LTVKSVSECADFMECKKTSRSVSENLVMNKTKEVGMRTRKMLTRWNKLCKERKKKRKERKRNRDGSEHRAMFFLTSNQAVVFVRSIGEVIKNIRAKRITGVCCCLCLCLVLDRG
jgi:hypothetical protein